MSISVNPLLPVIAAQGAAPDLLLQPGSVVDAQVLKILADNLVRIAIANVSIDVLSEIPLPVGQALQLAVSQTPDSIRLAVVGQGAVPSSGASIDTVTLAPGAIADVAAGSLAAAVPPQNVLTAPERVAVSAAAESAVTQQESLAPLFANLGAVVGSNGLPSQLQQAVMQVLAQRTSLDPGLTGNDVRNAFQKSGLFLEASLAAGSAPPAGGIPDLKAALIVLRQTLVSSLGTEAAAQSPAAPATVAQQAAVPGAPLVPAADPVSPQPAASPEPALATPTLAPSLSPDIAAQEILLPQARAPLADVSLQPGNTVRIVLSETLLNAGPRTMTSGAVLNLLQEALQPIPRTAGNASLPAVLPQNGRVDDVTFHTNTPPPPFRGALPSAQPVAAPSIAPDAPLATTARHLLGETDAAIARQTLLQVASLPDRVDTSVPRWNFEIPFVTPQGTAMTQFEISRDGGGHEVEAAKRVWRARFSLDVEPAGPIHALISLSGERTSVRMWAERPATAAQLRAGAAQLSQALSKAELQPGDIVIRAGTPPASAPARAGHFLDRAL